MKEKAFLLICGLWAVFCIPAIGKIIYVDDDATGTNDGSSWENAYVYLQNALADAEAAEKPVEVRVAQGIYKPDQGVGTRPSYTSNKFQLNNGIFLRGGFAGLIEDDPNTVDSDLYKTILSGDLADNDLEFENSLDIHNKPYMTDNCYQILTANTVDQNVILDGFIITGAKARLTGDEGSRTRTSGLFISNSSNIAVRNCKFIKNATSGIFCDCSNLSVSNCIFETNRNRFGGGGISVKESSIEITKCTFNDNQAFLGGGLKSNESKIYLENSFFTQNIVYGCRGHSCGLGGAFYCDDALVGTVVINCLFSDNIAVGGGGIYLGTDELKPYGRCEEIFVYGCTFTHNQAPVGATIYHYTNPVKMQNCSFINNIAKSNNFGIILYNDFGITTLSNCLFTGNSVSSQGSIVYAYGSNWPDDTLEHFISLEVRNCSIVDNVTPSGWTITNKSEGSEELDNVNISNCIIRNNGNEVYNQNGALFTINYTNLQGGVDSIDDPCNAVVWGIGNIDVDPCFAAPGYWADANDPNIIAEPNDPNSIWIEGDYHLKSQAGRFDPNSEEWVYDDETSLCIDAGDPNSPIGYEPYPNGGIINMGAYGGTAEASKSYFGEPLCETIVAGDINGDCRVDFADIEILLIHWLEDNNL